MATIIDLVRDLGTTYLQSRFQTAQTPTIIPADNPYIPNLIEGLYDPSVNNPQPTPTGDQCYHGRYLTYDTQTGQFKPRRRRRRRAMLTKSDIADLNVIATLPNSANVKMALAQRIGRA